MCWRALAHDEPLLVPCNILYAVRLQKISEWQVASHWAFGKLKARRWQINWTTFFSAPFFKKCHLILDNVPTGCCFNSVSYRHVFGSTDTKLIWEMLRQRGFGVSERGDWWARGHCEGQHTERPAMARCATEHAHSLLWSNSPRSHALWLAILHYTQRERTEEGEQLLQELERGRQ